MQGFHDWEFFVLYRNAFQLQVTWHPFDCDLNHKMYINGFTKSPWVDCLRAGLTSECCNQEHRLPLFDYPTICNMLVFFFLKDTIFLDLLFSSFLIEVDLHYVNFCCAAKWLSYTHTHTHTHVLFHILFHYCLSQDIEYSCAIQEDVVV